MEESIMSPVCGLMQLHCITTSESSMLQVLQWTLKALPLETMRGTELVTADNVQSSFTYVSSKIRAQQRRPEGGGGCICVWVCLYLSIQIIILDEEFKPMQWLRLRFATAFPMSGFQVWHSVVRVSRPWRYHTLQPVVKVAAAWRLVVAKKRAVMELAHILRVRYLSVDRRVGI